MSLYESVDVWKRVSKSELIRYRCFKNIATNKFSVQSADFYHVPPDSAQVANLEKQYLELLAEQAPDERSEAAFSSLAEAIEAHDREFRSS
jgi:hypothetical protein